MVKKGSRFNHQPPTTSHHQQPPTVFVATPDGILIDVRVIPRAGRSGVAGTRDGALLVRLNAAPVDGAANAELIEVISKALGVPKRAVSIASGERSRRKTVRVAGTSVAEASLKLNGLDL
jgi:uncharacterized protein (TIGR00251 family)